MTAVSGSRTGALLRNVALYLLAFTFIIVWLPLVRSVLDGPSYQWGTSYFGWTFSGAGLAGDFWFLVVQAALALAALYLGFRRPGVFSYALLVGWLALGAASVAYAYFHDGGLVFRGDTLGVEVNLTLFAFALYAIALAAAVAAALLEHGGGARPPAFAWRTSNTVAFALAVALLPVQYLLLRYSSGQETADQVGVILTMVQWAAVVFALGLARKTSI